MKNIMFIAPPAAGKGTQAELVVEKYHIPHISTGDILREISKEDSEIGEYVRETFNFGLLEDFDHLYRYAQFAYMREGIEPNDIVQGQTDVIIGRPTQHHHNCNGLRLRKHYDKTTATPQTKVNILIRKPHFLIPYIITSLLMSSLNLTFLFL